MLGSYKILQDARPHFSPRETAGQERIGRSLLTVANYQRTRIPLGRAGTEADDVYVRRHCLTSLRKALASGAVTGTACQEDNQK